MSEPVPLAQARAWLHDWQLVGGGVTIAPSGNLATWRITVVDDTPTVEKQLAMAERATDLLAHLLLHPELIGPIRVILSSKARATVRKTLGDIL